MERSHYDMDLGKKKHLKQIFKTIDSWALVTSYAIHERYLFAKHDPYMRSWFGAINLTVRRAPWTYLGPPGAMTIMVEVGDGKVSKDPWVCKISTSLDHPNPLTCSPQVVTVLGDIIFWISIQGWVTVESMCLNLPIISITFWKKMVAQ